VGSKIISHHGKQNLRILFYRYILIGIIAVGLKFIPNIWTFALGRLIHGFSGGVLNVCFQKVLIDTIPTEVIQNYNLFVNMGFNIGIFFISLISSLICPFVEGGI
jgi:MFS family permease